MISAVFRKTIPVLLFVFLFSAPSWASRDEIRITSVGWTDVTITSELAVTILETLGYPASNLMTSVPICYTAMSSGDVDIFLGNWMPSMASVAKPHFEDGTVLQLNPILNGAKYTLAVPTYVAEEGLRSFKDIVKFGDKLDWKIYGIEEGNDGNAIILDMIAKNMYDLGKFELVPSSEAGMLAEVESFMREKKWVVFLGWEPHSMNEKLKMTYLKGSTAETFGPNDGTATVYINVRNDFPIEHPNITHFLKNFSVPMDMMNAVMLVMYDHPDMRASDAALNWLAKNPEAYKPWFTGVKTKNGKSALVAFEAMMDSRKK